MAALPDLDCKPKRSQPAHGCEIPHEEVSGAAPQHQKKAPTPLANQTDWLCHRTRPVRVLVSDSRRLK